MQDDSHGATQSIVPTWSAALTDETAFSEAVTPHVRAPHPSTAVERSVLGAAGFPTMRARGPMSLILLLGTTTTRPCRFGGRAPRGAVRHGAR